MSRLYSALALFVVTSLSCLPLQVRAQAPIVGPGDPAVDGSRVQPGTRVLKIAIDAGGRVTDMGTLTLETTSMVINGDSVWRVVQKAESKAGVETDTLIVARVSLMPRTLHEFATAGSTMLEYKGTSVGGEHRDPEGSAQAIAQTLPRPSFDSGSLDLILAALPLKTGYAARLPMFAFEEGPHSYDIKVVGEVVIDGIAAWSVDINMHNGTVNYAVSKGDNGILVAKATSNGMVMTMTRVKR